MKRLRILVVEDDALLGMLLAETLVQMGHEVGEIAATEAEAVAAAARCKPDLMIVDLRLAGGSGASAVATILDTGPLPHLFISGELARLGSAGPVALQKPFREGDLARAIERALG